MLRRFPLLLTALALSLAAACDHGATTAGGPLPGSSKGPVLAPALSAARASGTTVPWTTPLTLTVANGTLQSVTVTAADGSALPGALADGAWRSATTLVPSQTYAVVAQVKGGDGSARTLSASYVAAAAAKVLHATLAPGNGSVVGVAQPVVIHFDQPVKGRANRLAAQRRLTVTTTPPVVGAWRWYNSYEVHYHAEKYWQSGTRIAVTANLAALRVGAQVWGAPKPATSAFRVGIDYRSVVDVAAHRMQVFQAGKLIRTIKVSTGRDKYPTKGGVHIVLTREKVHTYNSATVGIPTDGPDGYYEKLPWSMRISNGGAFVHANPATTGVQGRRNVSHGCVNTSVTDAKWFYYHSQLGDPVDIIHAAVKPVRWDAGMADWNYTWAEWQAGNLDG